MSLEQQVSQLVSQTQQLDSTIRHEIIDVNGDVEALRSRITDLEIKTGIPLDEGGSIPNAGGGHPTQPPSGAGDGNEVIKIDEEGLAIYIWDRETESWVTIPFTTIAPDIDIDVDAVVQAAEAAINQGLLDDIEALKASIQADVLSTQQAQIDGLVSTTTTHGTKIDDNIAAIQAETTARSTADAAMAQDINTLVASVDDNHQAFLNFQAAVAADPDNAAAEVLQQMQTDIDGNKAALALESSVRANADTSIAAQIANLTSSTENAQTAITQELTARTQADEALAARIDQTVASLGEASAALSQVQTTLSNVDLTAVSDVTTLQSTVGSMQTTVNDIATSVNGIQGSRTISINANGQVTGMQILGGSNTGSKIKFAASNFVVYDPNTELESIPFYISGGKTYINKAAIKQASIDRLLIGNEAVSIIRDTQRTDGKLGTASAGGSVSASQEVASLSVHVPETTDVILMAALQVGFAGNFGTNWSQAYALKVDNSNVFSRQIGVVNDTPVIIMSRTLSAGSHTIKLYWNAWNNNAGTYAGLGTRTITAFCPMR